jgi:hypothetical protein
MARADLLPLRITEAAIHRYGIIPLSYWAHCKHRTRNSGGAVYKSFTEQRHGKFRWGRAKFFSVMAMLVDAGLAVKYPWGWALATTTKVVGTHKGKEVRHKCTMLLPKRCGHGFILDMLRMKLMEMGWRQNDHYSTAMTPEQKFEAGKISVKTCGRLIRQLSGRPAQNPITGVLGSTPEQLLKCAQDGYVPMNTERLMKVTGLGRAALFAWKKRAKARGWFDQMNRTFDVPAELLAGLEVMHEHWQATCRGKFSWGVSPKFHQAALYKLNIDY